MTNIDQHRFYVKSDIEIVSQNQHCKRGKGSAKTKSPTRCRKTPSPQKEYKILQRRSPTNVASSPKARFESRASNNHHVPSSESRVSDDEEPVFSCSPNEMQLESTYAGARFQSPPSPNALPKPPTHWLNAKCATVDPMLNAPFLDTIAVHLKGLLNVQA